MTACLCGSSRDTDRLCANEPFRHAQLYLNYKLKSVAHLPWRQMTYKFLNTIVDDLGAFVIKMPTLHRCPATGCIGNRLKPGAPALDARMTGRDACGRGQAVLCSVPTCLKTGMRGFPACYRPRMCFPQAGRVP